MTAKEVKGAPPTRDSQGVAGWDWSTGRWHGNKAGGALDEGSKPTKTEGRHMVAGAGLGVTKDTRKLLGVMGLRVDLILVRVPQDYVHLGKNLSNCTL